MKKELGNLALYLRKKECPACLGGGSGPFRPWSCPPRWDGVALKRRGRLFTKNTGLCKLARGGRGTDTCPVPEGEAEGFPPRGEAPVNGGRNSDGPKVAKFLVR